MDLSFSRFEPDGTAIAMPGDLAVLLVGIAARQANSPTALIGAYSGIQAKPEDLLRPVHGAFNRAMAALICRWRQE
ncbi:MAG: hypothetical protein B7Y43_13670 [Sphingomonas sp. 28-62-20]|nr:hypothetical protein [Sphingomonas sp.]OQW78422.1 MAG: hypothetical protein BVN33_00835 [Proteobacteria bacterium ST_bin13]OYY76797.1 MAG: hypothetical protein B7Y43_13670 [Sphingomonas sp. 28-62-20]